MMGTPHSVMVLQARKDSYWVFYISGFVLNSLVNDMQAYFISHLKKGYEKCPNDELFPFCYKNIFPMRH